MTNKQHKFSYGSRPILTNRNGFRSEASITKQMWWSDPAHWRQQVHQTTHKKEKENYSSGGKVTTLPSSLFPKVTTSLRHHFGSSPPPLLTTSQSHHFPRSPLPFITTLSSSLTILFVRNPEVLLPNFPWSWHFFSSKCCASWKKKHCRQLCYCTLCTGM